MTVERDVGFVLRTWPLREADVIVSILTRDRGKLRGVAHGARRPRSPWSGALDPLCEIEVHHSVREGQELHSLRSEVTILRSPYAPMPSLPATWTLAFVAELVDATAPPHDADDALYRLLRADVDALLEGASPEGVARHAEVWVLRLAGVLPDSDRCASCGASLAEDGGTWSSTLSGLACGRCVVGEVGEGGPTLLAEDVTFLAEARHVHPRDARLASPRSARRVGLFLARLLHEFLGRELASERFLAEIERFAP